MCTRGSNRVLLRGPSTSPLGAPMLIYFAGKPSVVLAHALAFTSLVYAAQLTEADAISIAKAATVKGCTVDTPCKYYARRDGAR